MAAPRESPFAASRFALREDSRTWSTEPSQPRKITRFASTGSVSSERDELELSAPSVYTTSRLALYLPAALAVALFAIALGIHLVRLPHLTPPNLYRIATNLSPPFSWRPRVSNPQVLPPALRSAIEEVVQSTLRAHDVSRRGLPDHALHAHGGRVVMKLTSGSSGLFSTRDDDPSIAINDDVHAGKCWNVGTLPSQLGIKLPRILYPTHISVEHLPAEISVDVGQAPKDIKIWGLVDGTRNKQVFANLVASGLLAEFEEQSPPISNGLLWAPLASFAYDIHGDNPVQTFPIPHVSVDSQLSFGVIAIALMDNWGANTTCLYRVRVHGRPV